MKRLRLVNILSICVLLGMIQELSIATPLTPQKGTYLSQANSTKLRQCQFSAFVIDKDPNGLNVRSGPASNNRVIVKLPTDVPVNVDISACQGDWLQISKAETYDNILFQGKGWVYASLLGISPVIYDSSGFVPLYSNPSTQSTKIAKVPSQRGRLKILTGSGKWIFVEYKGLKGWLAPSNQCPIAETTCN